MKQIYTILLLVMVAGICWKCEKTTPSEYEDEPRLYFTKNKNQSDSLAYSFFTQPTGTERDTVYVEVHTMGDTMSYNRPVDIRQVNIGEEDAAVPGRDYISLENAWIKERMIIPAGKEKVKIPIIVLRTPEQELETFSIELEIVENEYFKKGVDLQTKFKVKITAMPTKPLLWTPYYDYVFGVWGPVKMKFIIDHVGYNNFDETISDFAYQEYLKTKSHAKLKELYPDPENPLKEADGTIVTFP